MALSIGTAHLSALGRRDLVEVCTIHSLDPCLACAVHTVDAEGTEIARTTVA